MTERSGFERQLPAYLEGRSVRRAPDGLIDAALAGVEKTRQVPGWLVLEWWLPARVTNRTAGTRTTILILATVALLVAIAIVLGVVGASRRPLPPPFGPARPGLLALDLGGHIFVTNPDGTGQRQLTSGADFDGRATWSPDGTLIAFQSLHSDATSALSVMDATGEDRVVLLDGIEGFGDIVWSPDSQRIAVSGRRIDDHYQHVYIVKVADRSATRLGGPYVGGIEPSWSPDGREIAFKRQFPCYVSTDPSEPVYCDATARAAALWLISADGSSARELTKTTGLDNALWNTAWAPDGRRLAFLADGVAGHYDVYVINADGTGERNISNSPQDEYWGTWSPDGTRIAFPRMSPTDGNAGTLFVVDPDGSKPLPLVGALINSNPPIWSPDGRHILGYVYNAALGNNDQVAIFDASGRVPPTLLPANDFGSITWQRLAP